MNYKETAVRFADALDEELYDVVASCLSDDCIYTIGGETHTGPRDIIAAYQENGDWAKQSIDRIEYDSDVLSNESGATVEFTDYLTHKGVRHTHRCRQHLQFDAQGRINGITHEDLPGEREALEGFFNSVGLERQT